jgi:hypothetical protein
MFRALFSKPAATQANQVSEDSKVHYQSSDLFATSAELCAHVRMSCCRQWWLKLGAEPQDASQMTLAIAETCSKEHSIAAGDTPEVTSIHDNKAAAIPTRRNVTMTWSQVQRQILEVTTEMLLEQRFPIRQNEHTVSCSSISCISNSYCQWVPVQMFSDGSVQMATVFLRTAYTRCCNA